MSIYKRGGVYWYKFQWQGKLIRESAKTGNDKVARKIEAAHRTRLAEGLVDIREKKAAPTFTQFCKDRTSHMRSPVHRGFGIGLECGPCRSMPPLWHAA